MLDRPVAQRIVLKLEQAAQEPPRFFSRLVGGDDYKLRVEVFQLLALLSHETTTILAERVAPMPSQSRWRKRCSHGSCFRGSRRRSIRHTDSGSDRLPFLLGLRRLGRDLRASEFLFKLCNLLLSLHLIVI